MNVNLSAQVKGSFVLQHLNQEGKLLFETKQENLVLDQGLDYLQVIYASGISFGAGTQEPQTSDTSLSVPKFFAGVIPQKTAVRDAANNNLVWTMKWAVAYRVPENSNVSELGLAVENNATRYIGTPTTVTNPNIIQLTKALIKYNNSPVSLTIKQGEYLNVSYEIQLAFPNYIQGDGLTVKRIDKNGVATEETYTYEGVLNSNVRASNPIDYLLNAFVPNVYYKVVGATPKDKTLQAADASEFDEGSLPANPDGWYTDYYRANFQTNYGDSLPRKAVMKFETSLKNFEPKKEFHLQNILINGFSVLSSKQHGDTYYLVSYNVVLANKANPRKCIKASNYDKIGVTITTSWDRA